MNKLFPLLLAITVLFTTRGQAESVGDYGAIMEGIGYEARNADSIMWVIDQSPSMADDIKQVHSRIEGLMQSYRKRGRKVPVGIITYADRPSVCLAPDEDPAKVKAAFGRIKTKGAGKEALFAAVELAVKTMKRAKRGYLVLVTDEAGDDDKKLETVAKMLVKKKIRVLVLSPNATFGNRTWHWDIISVKAKNTTFYNSQNGPESLTPELLYDFNFLQRSTWSSTINPMEYRVWALKAGWAPFGLQLLAEHTGGKVFELETDTCKLRGGDFDEKKKKQYAPEIALPSQARKNMMKHSWRRTMFQAQEYWSKNFKTIAREWPGQTKAILIAGVESQVPTVKSNIRVAEKTLDMLKTAFDSPLKAPAAGYSMDEEEEPVSHLRWRANLELAYASALVARYHSHQFLVDVERFKQDSFWPDPQNNVCQWNIKIVADGKRLDKEPLKEKGYEISGGPVHGLLDIRKVIGDELAGDVKGMRIQAERALRVVIQNHKDTPWETMARKLLRELGHYDVFINPCGNWGNSSASQ